MAVAKVTTTLSSTAVNDFEFSWSGNRITVSRAGDTPALNGTIRAAVPTVFPLSGKHHKGSVARPQGWFGDPTGTIRIFAPWNNRHDLFGWNDDFHKVMRAATVN